MKGAEADKRYGALLVLASALFLFFLAGRAGVFSFRPAVQTGAAAQESAAAVPSKTVLNPKKTKGALEKGTSVPGFPVDVNSADKAGLMLLPGVGEKTAERIMEKRAELNGFKSAEDLLMVKYIGEKKLDRLRGFITVKGGKRE